MRVSVVTTLYNYREYIEETIRSFLEQNFQDSEMIIVDDASIDNPYKVIKKYSSNSVRYIRLDKNRGYSHAKNVGIKESKSEILVMLDADDKLTPNSLSSRFERISEGFDLVHGPALNLKNGKISKSKLWEQWNRKNIFKNVHAQSVMLRKDIHRKIGLYDETLKCKSDREMWARIFNHNFIVGTVNDPVVIYRIHNRQMSRSNEKLKMNKKLQEDVMKKIATRKHDLSGLEMLCAQ